MSLVHFSLGLTVLKSRSNRFGAMGLLWFESVVILYFRLALARKFRAFIRATTRFSLHGILRSNSSLVILGEP